MSFWYSQDVVALEAALNEAVASLDLNEGFKTMDERMKSLSAKGIVYPFQFCTCSPNAAYFILDPPDDTVCAWSVLLSILTGQEDPRAELEVFQPHEFPCHSQNYDDFLNRESKMFNAFTNTTKVIF